MTKKPKGRLKHAIENQLTLQPEITRSQSFFKFNFNHQPYQLLFPLVFSLLIVLLNITMSSSSASNRTSSRGAVISQTPSDAAAISAELSGARHYHVNLPKVGIISGLPINIKGPQVATATTSSSDGADELHQKQTIEGQVVGFLGIPYAAPPIGPLRFMPPGALQQQQQQQQADHNKNKQQQQQHQVILMPNGQQANVRSFNRLGSRCIHLADWLNHSNDSSSSSSSSSSNNNSRSNDHQDNNNHQDQFLLPSKEFIDRQQKQKQRQKLKLNQQQQSEDCLNLNVFVPIKAINEKKLKQTITSQQQQQQQSMTSNKSDNHHHQQHQRLAVVAANHAQFGHQGQQQSGQSRAASAAAIATQEYSWPLLDLGHKLPVLVVIQQQQQQMIAEGTSKDGQQQQLALQQKQTSNRQMTSSHQNVVADISDHQNGKIELDNQAKTALQTDSIVITFNYRTGLLGFLPYADDEMQQQQRGGNSKQPARYNHAIWDLIGLLHWIKRNIQTFGGDSNNVVLAAADNRATIHLQLLCMTPLAKGLFHRAIILHHHHHPKDCRSESSNHSDDDEDVNLTRLIEVANNNIELRARLSNSLLEIVNRQNTPSNSSSSPNSVLESLPASNVYDFMLLASLQQLAQIEYQLNEKYQSTNSNNHNHLLLLLINEPSLDDPLLFPHLRPLIDHEMKLGQSNSLLRSVQAELNYCTYVRRMYSTSSLKDAHSPIKDPMQLINLPLAANESSLINQSSYLKSNDATIMNSSGWHREPGRKLSTNNRISVSNQQGSSSRSMAVQYFNHLNYLSSLIRILVINQRQSSDFESGHIDDKDDNQSSIKRDTFTGYETTFKQEHDIERRDDYYRRDGGSGRRTKIMSESQSIEETNSLAESISSIDIMFGYLNHCRHPDKNHHHQIIHQQQQNSSANFSRLIERLLNNTNSEHIDNNNNLIAWLKWIDFYAILSASSKLTSSSSSSSPVNMGLSQYCDFSSLFSSSISNNNETTTSLSTGLKNNYVFISKSGENFNGHPEEDEEDRYSFFKTVQQTNKRIQFGLRNFIESGDANYHQVDQSSADNNNNDDNTWPNYEALDRYFEGVEAEEGFKSMKNQLRIQLDIVPYLTNELSRFATLMSQNDHANQSFSDRSKLNPISSLLNCLGEIESELSVQDVSKIPPGNKLMPKINCLTNSLAKFRSLTRSYAAQDLEPLITKINSMNNNNQMWEFASPHKSSGTGNSLITTRNLVNQLFDSEDTSPNNASSGETNLYFEDKSNHHSLILTNGSSNWTSERQLSIKSQPSKLADRMIEANNKSLLARIVKFSEGKALSIVIATGFVIFLVNLIIFVVITLRSSRQRRRSIINNNNNNSNGLMGAKSSQQQQQQISSTRIEQENDQSFAADCPPSSSNDKETSRSATTMKLASSLRKSSSISTTNGFSTDTSKNMRTVRATKQLKFNLGNEDEKKKDYRKMSDVVVVEPISKQVYDTNDNDNHQHQHQHHHEEMIQLGELTNNCYKDNDPRFPILDTTSIDLNSIHPNEHYLLEPHQHQHQHNHHHHHDHPNQLLNNCETHHNHHHHHRCNQRQLDLNQTNLDQFVEIIQSPFANSLATTTSQTSSSSTFKQNASNGGGKIKEITPITGTNYHHHHQAIQFNSNSTGNGSVVCSSHSPNSSTTLSMTPNQNLTDQSSTYPHQHQFTTLLEPIAYQQQQQQYLNYNNHLNQQPNGGDASSFEITEHDHDHDQYHYREFQGSFEELVNNTLKRQKHRNISSSNLDANKTINRNDD